MDDSGVKRRPPRSGCPWRRTPLLICSDIPDVGVVLAPAPARLSADLVLIIIHEIKTFNLIDLVGSKLSRLLSTARRRKLPIHSVVKAILICVI